MDGISARAGVERKARWSIAIVLGLATGALAGAGGASCGRGEREEGRGGERSGETAEAPPASAPRAAMARIVARSGAGLSGHATFTEVDGGVKVLVEVEGAPPGRHGVHVHEKGDCSAPDGSSAGEHFNPDGVRHGAPHGAEHHVGDFGNMEVGADARGRLELVAEKLTVGPGSYSVVGRAIIIHEREDDFSQPAGNAGARIGCGMIEPSP